MTHETFTTFAPTRGELRGPTVPPLAARAPRTAEPRDHGPATTVPTLSQAWADEHRRSLLLAEIEASGPAGVDATNLANLAHLIRRRLKTAVPWEVADRATAADLAELERAGLIQVAEDGRRVASALVGVPVAAWKIAADRDDVARFISDHGPRGVPRAGLAGARIRSKTPTATRFIAEPADRAAELIDAGRVIVRENRLIADKVRGITDHRFDALRVAEHLAEVIARQGVAGVDHSKIAAGWSTIATNALGRWSHSVSLDEALSLAVNAGYVVRDRDREGTYIARFFDAASPSSWHAEALAAALLARITYAGAGGVSVAELSAQLYGGEIAGRDVRAQVAPLISVGLVKRRTRIEGGRITTRYTARKENF